MARVAKMKSYDRDNQWEIKKICLQLLSKSQNCQVLFTVMILQNVTGESWQLVAEDVTEDDHSQ